MACCAAVARPFDRILLGLPLGLTDCAPTYSVISLELSEYQILRHRDFLDMPCMPCFFIPMIHHAVLRRLLHRH